MRTQLWSRVLQNILLCQVLSLWWLERQGAGRSWDSWGRWETLGRCRAVATQNLYKTIPVYSQLYCHTNVYHLIQSCERTYTCTHTSPPTHPIKIKTKMTLHYMYFSTACFFHLITCHRHLFMSVHKNLCHSYESIHCVVTFLANPLQINTI